MTRRTIGTRIAVVLVTLAALLAGAPQASGRPVDRAPAAAANGPSRFTPLSTLTVVDAGLQARVTTYVTLTDHGLPSGITAVAISLSATTVHQPGYVTAWPAGSARPGVSVLNVRTRHTSSNVAIVPVGAGNRIMLYNGSDGALRLIGRVTGYYRPVTADDADDAAGAFVALPPARLVDTRAARPVSAKGSGAVPVAGHAGVPRTGVSAVVVNLTATRASAPGYLTAYADGAARPATSNLSFVAGTTIPNLAVVPVGPDGSIRLFNGSTAPVDALLDVSGYFRTVGSPSQAATGATVPVPAGRLLDTRRPKATLGSGASRSFSVAGRAGLAARPGAVILSVTATGARANGYVTAWPTASVRPQVASVSFERGVTITLLSVVPVPSTGRVSVYNAAPDDVDVTVDVVGYVAESPAWYAESLATPSAATGLTASCVPGGPCRMLGERTTGAGTRQAFTRIHTATGWSQPEDIADLLGAASLSCASATRCAAVGNAAAAPVGPYAALLSAGTWTRSTLPVTSDPASARVESVSCASETACVAVGRDDGPAAWTLAGGTWTEHVLTQVEAPASALTAVSCVSATHCVATSATRDPRGFVATSATTLDGGAWTTVPVLVYVVLDNIDCVSASYCVAAGDPTGDGGIVAVFSDGNWTTQTLRAFGKGLRAVACTGTDRCVLLGDASGPLETAHPGAMTLTADGFGRFVPLTPTDSDSAPGRMLDLACASATDCVAVGADAGAGSAAQVLR